MKTTDGDLTKWVNGTVKPRDNAQKWRAFKNIARFFKNPVGYTYWKIEPFHGQNRFRFIYALLAFHLYQSFLLWVLVKNKKEKMIEHWKYKIGETNRNHNAGHKDRRMPINKIKNYVRYSNFHQALRCKRLSMIHLNWWCRDQNFRKYFEMRKKNDMKPSLSGFYHEKIFDEATAKNQAISDMRNSRQAM